MVPSAVHRRVAALEAELAIRLAAVRAGTALDF